MLYRREGYPDEDELVLCTVTNVQFNSVFCKLDEYDKSGMIHISEVSPGRIRNIRDYVSEGKKVVCKVLAVKLDRGHIDLSLRRVSDSLRREKNASIKQEIKAEKLLEHYAKIELKLPIEKLYAAVATPILKEYEYLHLAFEDIVEGEADLQSLGVPKEYATRLTEIIKEKIPPKKVTIKGAISISTYGENGVEDVKKALIAAQKTHKEVELSYLGNGMYRLTVVADDYEHAEDIVKKAVQAATDIISADPTGKIVFAREAK